MRVVLDRFRLVSGFRLLSALCLVLLAGTIFWQPITRIVRPQVVPSLQHLQVPELLRPKSQGFMVRVVSEPASAEVSIDGATRGSTPLFANVICKQDQEIRITVEKRGFPTWHRAVRCRVGGELTVQAQLGG